MTAVNLTVDVYCKQFSSFSTTAIFPHIQYRLYVDDDLLTERSWIWNNSNFICENIWIHTKLQSTHILKVEYFCLPNVAAVISINNLQVIDQPFTSEQINDLTISFTL